jgi:hypothetical protein
MAVKFINLLLIGSCFLFHFAHSQARLKVSNKHVSKINNQSSASKKLALYRKYFKKDSIKYVRETDRYWQSKTDSIADYIHKREKAIDSKKKAIADGATSKVYNTVYRPWARRLAKNQIDWLDKHKIRISSFSRIALLNYFEDYFLQASQDESKLTELKQQMPDIPLPKQLSSKLNTYKILNPEKVKEFEQLAKGKLPGLEGVKDLQSKAQQYTGKVNGVKDKAQQYSGKLDEYSQYAKTFSNTDSLKGFVQTRGEEMASAYVSKIDGFSELGKAQGDLDKLKSLPDQYKTQIEQLQDSAYIKEQAKKKAEELAMNYISEHPEIMQGVQKKMALLMKKYSIVPNSNDLSTAVKRTSLEGRRFRERLYFAGNFQVLNLDPFSIDLSPMIGYRFNTRFLAGIGANYRQSFKDTIPSFSPTVFGYKAFTSYDVVKNFFAYAEFDRNSPGVKRTEAGSQLLWKNAAFAGVGRKFMIRPKLEMTVLMLYNFFHDIKDPVYPRAWNVRVGFQTSELAFFKAKPRF